jgi:hypothetical protein
MPRVGKTFKIDREIVERFENAVEACSGPPWCLDEATAVERLLRRGTTQMERDYNDGEPFPASRRLRTKRREQKKRLRERQQRQQPRRRRAA